MRSAYQKLLFYYGYKRQKVNVRNAPLKVWIEPTNACNIACELCPQSSQNFPSRGFMETGLFEKIADDLQTVKPLLVTLHLSGEPLLHPQISRFIKIIKSKGLEVTFSTNGLLLTRQKAEEIIDAGLDGIRIDFAADKNVYERIRHKAKWDVVYQNILALLEIKKQKGLFKPKIHLVNIDIDGDEKKLKNNISAIKDLFKGHSFEIQNLELHTWAGEFAQTTANNPLFKRLLTSQDAGRRYFPCHHIFGSFVITWDGDVVPCCRDLKKDYVIGNVREHSISELWNCERAKHLRQKQILGQYQDVPLCRGCTQLWNSPGLGKLLKNSFRKFFRFRTFV